MHSPLLSRTGPKSAARRVRAGLLLLLLLPVQAVATETTLSLRDATRLAVARAPLLQARDAGVRAAREESLRADALPDPTLLVGIDNLPVTGPDAYDPGADFMTMKRIGLRQELPSRGKRHARRVLGERTVDQALAQSQSDLLEVARQAAIAWVDLWAAQRELAELETLGAHSRLAADLVRARVHGGAASASDALGAQTLVLQIDNRIEAASAKQEAAGVALARWIGGPAPVQLQPLRADPPPDFARLAVPEDRLLAGVDRLGPLLVARARSEHAAAEVDLALAEKRPDWMLAASYGQRDRGRSDMLMLEVGIRLPIFAASRQDRGVAAREAEYQATVAMQQDLRERYAAMIRADIARWSGLVGQVERDEQALLPLSRDRSATALAAYRGGASLDPWLAARRDELEAVVDHARRQGELGRAWAGLAYLLPGEAQP